MAQATEDENRADAQTLAQLMHTLAFLPKPTLARVNGAAYGGGVGLVACCDIAIASVQAKFALAFMVSLAWTVVSTLLALPWLIYQLWAFVAPGLYSQEKRFALPLIVFGRAAE